MRPPFAHQTVGVAAIMAHPRFLLADSMRLGKTRQAIDAVQELWLRGAIDAALVIAPGEVARSVWASHETGQIFEYTRVPSRLELIRSGKTTTWEYTPDSWTGTDKQLQWKVINYELMRRPERLKVLLASITPRTMLILDESSAVNSPSSKQTKAVFELAKVCERVLLLNGTPHGDNPGHLHAPFKILDSKILGCGNWYQFQAKYCNTPDAPIWMADQSFKALGDVEVGNEVMGWVSEPRESGKRALSRRLSPARVLGVSRRIADNVVRVTFESGRVLTCTDDHKWLSHSHGGVGADIFVPVAHARQRRGPTLCRVVEKPRELSQDESAIATWLAGIYDGEGSSNYIAQSATHNPEVCARIVASLKTLGIPYRRDKMGFTMLGGLQTYVNVLTWLHITRRASLERMILKSTYSRFARKADRAAQMKRMADRVVRIERLPTQEVVSLQTTTGNYFPWGYASKNCVMGGFRKLRNVRTETGWKKKMEPVQVVGWTNLDDLYDRTRPYILRRTLDEVFDLPPALDPVTLEVPLEPATWSIYKSMRDDAILRLESGEVVTAAQAGVLVMRLAQITSGFVGGVEGQEEPVVLGDEKLRSVLAWHTARLAEDPNFRVIFWCKFRLETERLAAALSNFVETRLLYGGQSGQDRADALTLMGPGCPESPAALVGITKTGGLGLDLSGASTTMYVSNDYSLMNRQQSAARMLGPNQKHACACFDLVATGPHGEKTVDHTILKALRAKEDMAAWGATRWAAELRDETL